MRYKLAFTLTIIILICQHIVAINVFAREWPRPSGPLADFAKVIKPSARQRITKASNDVFRETKAAIVVVTIPSLDGETIESYSYHLFNKWGIGNKDRNDGILILVAIMDRKIRIELGLGMEKIIGIKATKHILHSIMIPKLKKNMFGEGLIDGIKALKEQILKYYKNN